MNRLVDHGQQGVVADEAEVVVDLGDGRSLFLGGLTHGGGGLDARVLPADHLDEPHERDGVQEMHFDGLVRATCGGGDE